MRLKELREERNLSQEAVALAVQTSQRNIGRWENKENEPTCSFLVKLANFFNVSIDYLVGNSDEFGAITVEGPELTQAEKQLLSNFRGADEVGKRSILITAQAFFNQAQENSKKPV